MPVDEDLDALADEHRHHPAPRQPGPTQALIEQLIDRIDITRPGHLRPTYRIPRTTHEETEHAAEDEPAVRAMGNVVGATGIEPVTARV